METIKIPTRFYDYHRENGCEAPAIVRKTKRHYFIDANSEHLDELLSSAEALHFHSWFDCEFGDSFWGVIRSANATEKAIYKHRGTWGVDVTIYEDR